MLTGRQVRWKGRLLGFYIKADEGLIFVSPRKLSHKFRMYNGWGINREFLNQLVETGVRQIRIVVDNGKKILITTPQRWKEKGIPHQSKGFEPQIVLREKDFDKVLG